MPSLVGSEMCIRDRGTAFAVLVSERVAEATCQPRMMGAALVNQPQGANHTATVCKRKLVFDCCCVTVAVRHTAVRCASAWLLASCFGIPGTFRPRLIICDYVDNRRYLATGRGLSVHWDTWYLVPCTGQAIGRALSTCTYDTWYTGAHTRYQVPGTRYRYQVIIQILCRYPVLVLFL